MPRYYFNIHNGSGLVEDDDGRELADLDVARAEGLKGVRSLIAEEVMQGRMDLDGRLEILGEGGAILLTIKFRDAVAGGG